MTLNKNKRYAIVAGVAFSLTALTTSLYAGGFQLFEQSAAGLGEYHAGGAAKADDASTEFYNPAGMTRLKHTEISTGLTTIRLRTNFKGTAKAEQPGFSLGGAASGNGDTNNYVPNFHVVVPFAINGKAAAFGFGVNAPFGLSTHYASSTATNSIGIGGTETNIQTINVGPSFAYAITNKLSAALGVDFMFGMADYDGDLSVLGQYKNHLEGAGWGFNGGLLWQPTKSTRLGVAYRSRVTINAHGPSYSYTGGEENPRTTASATLSIPAYTEVSLHHDFNHRWSVDASGMYTQWNVFKTLTITNMSISDLPDVEHFDYKNSWFGALGTKFWVNSRNALSLGVGYDQTPTQNGHRDIRLPDANRWAGSVGWEFKYDCNMDLSIGYAYLGMAKAAIDNSKDGGTTVVKGTSTGHANIVGVQLSYKF